MIQPGAVVGRRGLVEALRSRRLRVSPSPPEQWIDNGTIDLTLGSIFLTAERSSVESIPAKDPGRAGVAFREARLRQKGSLVIQPHQFVLASTFEYLVVPDDLAGLIQSRSTLGRMGLISATAAYVHPGYKGCPTLELVNAGEVPITIAPRDRVCQFIVFTAMSFEQRPSRYQLATRPSVPASSFRWAEEPKQVDESDTSR